MTPEVKLGFFKLIEGIAWPLVVLILALVYKHDIRSIKFTQLFKTIKTKVFGIELELEAAEQQKKTGEVVTVDASTGVIELKELPGLQRTTAIANLEKELHSNLQRIPADQQTDILIRHLAQARLEAAFGIVYAGIFGSQILGLIQLEARRRAPVKEAVEFYQQYERNFPDVYTGYGYTGWFNFIRNSGLVELQGEDIILTAVGEDFLSWLKARKLSINKLW
jgi:hypothetical protein